MQPPGVRAEIDIGESALGATLPAPGPSSEPQRILVVDDDERLCRLLGRMLMSEGFSVACAHDGAGMWHMLRSRPHDLLILDLRLPGAEDGLTLARRLRENSDVPLIMLTGRTDSTDKVLGLDIGADDYITKPFDNQELMARIRSVLRRASSRRQRLPAAQTADVVRFAGRSFHIREREVETMPGQRTALTGYEHDLLLAFIQNQGVVLSRDQICELVANRHWRPDDRSIDVLVAKLRRKLGDESRNPALIKTVRGRGYIFTPLVSRD
jgi:DNA-binding response OmpR family regulator